jgi:hypothetical protein
MSPAAINNRDQGVAAGSAVAGLGATEQTDPSSAGTCPGRASAAGASANDAAAEVTAANSFLFELVTAALYHRSRVTWFAALHRVGMFLNILAGTAALSLPKILSARIRAMRENQSIIRRDACHPPSARNVRRQPFQVAAPA